MGRLLRAAAGCFFAFATLLVPESAGAWGATGHRTVGRVAENHLTPAAAQALAALLGTESLARASTWADEIRSDPAWKHAEPWHFASVEDGKTYDESPKSPEGDVVEALVRFEALLADPTTPPVERCQAIRWLAHLIGDIHQPLHVGRAADRGGNDVVVLWFNQPSNLHTVWDEGMIDHSRLSFSELALFIDHTTPEQVAAWQATSYREWARESIVLRAEIYELGDRKLSYRYIYDHFPKVEQRLLQAGVRLAGVLNRLFNSATAMSARPPL